MLNVNSPVFLEFPADQEDPVLLEVPKKRERLVKEIHLKRITVDRQKKQKTF